MKELLEHLARGLVERPEAVRWIDPIHRDG